MRIGVPKEIKAQEYRVGLTPDAVREFTARGHSVLVEGGAGDGLRASDDAYQSAGAAIVATAPEIYAQADMIVKVKEPQPSEWPLLRRDQILFAYLHLAPDPDQSNGLMASGCSAIAYETVAEPDGTLPLLAPMSEVAGRLAIEAAALGLRRHAGGRGLLLGGVPGVLPAKVLIIGGGVVGFNAARMAIGLGADVTVLDRSLPRLRQIDELCQGRVRTRFSSIAAVEQEIAAADVVIGAVLVPGASAPKLVTRAMLGLMRPAAVMVDVAIDQGGCFETSRATTYDAPTFIVDGIVHYCVANMPAAVPLTASHALNHATLPFGLALAERGMAAVAADARLRAGLNVYRGRITNAAVAGSLGLPYLPADDLPAA